MENKRKSFALRLILAPFKMLVFIACVAISVVLNFADEHGKAEKLMDWVLRETK